MLHSWIYCFKQSNKARDFLDFLLRERKEGRFLGSTFPNRWCHSCFSTEQCKSMDIFLNNTDLEVQVCSFFTGNLFDCDFGIDTFKQPLVQWCPDPIYSRTFQQSISDNEPWGLTMEGEILLPVEFRENVDKITTGLKFRSSDTKEAFDTYEIAYDRISLIHSEGITKPLSIDCSMCPNVDILRLDNGIILCSSRFAILLEHSWNGFVHAKFQPICCINYCGHMYIVPEKVNEDSRYY
jgi:hypothetical protein